MVNVSSNILEKENGEFEANKEVWEEQLENMTRENTKINKTLHSNNEKYERYKLNLVSALNSEQSIENKLKWSKSWMIFHIYFVCILIVVIIILLIIPKNKVPNNYDLLALYIICGCTMLYTLVMGMIGVIKMLIS